MNSSLNIVAIFAVNVSEGGVQYLRDGIISRPIWPIGKLERVQSSRDGGAICVSLKVSQNLHDY